MDDKDKTALVDFGEFDCGVVDFTNPDAAAWFAERVIGRNMIDFGLSGWMADFGEYLPIDVHLANGVDAKLMHNAWPTLWAEVNARAVEKRGETGDILFFMRAGFTGVQKYCPLLWGGDQSVDFSRHDGLVTVICGALSSGPPRQCLSSFRYRRLYEPFRQCSHRRNSSCAGPRWRPLRRSCALTKATVRATICNSTRIPKFWRISPA